MCNICEDYSMQVGQLYGDLLERQMKPIWSKGTWQFIPNLFPENRQANGKNILSLYLHGTNELYMPDKNHTNEEILVANLTSLDTLHLIQLVKKIQEIPAIKALTNP